MEPTIYLFFNGNCLDAMSHYAEASLSQQFDAYVWFDETNPVIPLGPEHKKTGVPDTYPFGL